MKRLMILFFLAVTAQLSAQNSGSILGYVFDDMGTPLPGANVYIKTPAGMIGSMTDVNGKYLIKPVVPGTYNMHISYVGFEKVEIRDIKVIGGRFTSITDVDLALASYLDSIPVIIGYKDPLIDPGNTGVTPMSFKAIEKLPENKKLTAILPSISSEISKDEKTGEIHIRGARAGSMIYFVDGMRTSSPDGGIPGAAIGSLKIYAGGIPAQYGDCTGGVVAVETKSFFDFWTGN